MALALYRRYRPDTFDRVIGQDQVTIPLSRALDSHTLTHAYLFSGPRGCGKTSCARILARCMNCEQGPTSYPCGKCQSCLDLSTSGTGSLDVVEIDAASHNGVDDARELRERAGFAPVSSRYKIFILDEAHMVTPQGFNALLKIVEEPPEHVKFIFATTEPDKVISTIRSRTHHYPFRLVPPEIMGPYLQKVCEQEHVRLDTGVLRILMRAGGGSVRDTLSVLDQLMVGADNGLVTYDSTIALLGFTPDYLIDMVIEGIIRHEGATVYTAVNKVIVGGFDPRRFVEDLLQRMRDLFLISLSDGNAQQMIGDEWLQQDAQYERLSQYAKVLGVQRIDDIAQILQDTLATMNGTLPPRMRLELMMARLLTSQEIGGLSSGDVEPSIEPPTVPSQSETQSSEVSQQAEQEITREPQPVQTPSHIDLSEMSNEEFDRAWDEVINALPAQVQELVDRTHVPSVRYEKRPSADRIYMTFDKPLSQYAFALAVVTDLEHDGKASQASAVLRKKIREAFGKNVAIAPDKKAANGEIVEPVTRMDPEQQTRIKQAIALAKTQQVMGKTAVNVQQQISTPQESRAHKTASSQEQQERSSEDDGSDRANVQVATIQGDEKNALTQSPSFSQLSPLTTLFSNEDDIWLQPGNMVSSNEAIASVGKSSPTEDHSLQDGVDWRDVASGRNDEERTATGSQNAYAREQLDNAPKNTDDKPIDDTAPTVTRVSGDEKNVPETPIPHASPEQTDNSVVTPEPSPIPNKNATDDHEDDYSLDDPRLGSELLSGAKAVTSVFAVSQTWDVEPDDPNNPFVIQQKRLKRQDE